jgi:hypothetical protein
MSPVVDGRTDSGYLKSFNDLNTENAEHYADLLAHQFCTDSRADSIQVDVEPLDFHSISKVPDEGGIFNNAQVDFYSELAKNLSGESLPVTTTAEAFEPGYGLETCRGKKRFVSVFTFAARIERAVEQKVADGKPTAIAKKTMALLARDNFLVIDSLYDLPGAEAVVSAPGGPGVSLAPGKNYYLNVKSEAEQMVALQKIYGFTYKFAIPASCSFHECDQSTVAAGATQLMYVKAALNAVADVNNAGPGNPGGMQGVICGNPKFKGLAIWAFNNHYVDNPIGSALLPSVHVRTPDPAVIQFLATKAWQTMCAPKPNSNP